MATRRSQRRKGRRGALGTALLPTLVLALGLSLACFGLLLVVISLGTQASPFPQDPAQQELVEEKEAEAVMQMISQSQNLAPILKRRVRLPRAVKGQKPRPRKANAAHYEVRPKEGMDRALAGMDGTVSGWEEAKINRTNPLSYDAKSAEFTVTRAGLYYLYCQVHFDEGKAVYLKLDLLVDGSLALRCLEEFSATAASSPSQQLRLCQGTDELEALKEEEMSRRKREVLTQEHQHKRKRSVLHLIPINSTSREDSDVTEIMWEPALRHGGGLQPQGHVVGVRETGMYLLYSQVLFHDVRFTMGQVVHREGQGREILSRCVCSMPSNPHQAYNSCYTAGVFQLYQGDILSLTIPRAGAKLDLTPHGTFLGLVKL